MDRFTIGIPRGRIQPLLLIENDFTKLSGRRTPVFDVGKKVIKSPLLLIP
jgi:hypothetical protein